VLCPAVPSRVFDNFKEQLDGKGRDRMLQPPPPGVQIRSRLIMSARNCFIEQNYFTASHNADLCVYNHHQRASWRSSEQSPRIAAHARPSSRLLLLFWPQPLISHLMLQCSSAKYASLKKLSLVYHAPTTAILMLTFFLCSLKSCRPTALL